MKLYSKASHLDIPDQTVHLFLLRSQAVMEEISGPAQGQSSYSNERLTEMKVGHDLRCHYNLS